MDKNTRICIIGAGPAGTSAAMYLEKAGYENYVIYEKSGRVGGKAFSPMMKVKNAEGQISFDRVGKAPGRGAYICRSAECLEKAVRQRQLERALETRIDESVFAQLMEEIHAD